MATINSVKPTNRNFKETTSESVTKSLDDIVNKKMKERTNATTVLPVLQHVDLPPQPEVREASLSQQGGALAEIRAKQVHNPVHNPVLSGVLRLQEKADTNLKSNGITVMETEKRKTPTGPLHDQIMVNPAQKKLLQSVTDRSDAMKIANVTSLNPSLVHLASSSQRDDPVAKKVEAAENRVMPEPGDRKGHPERENLLHQLSGNTSVLSQRVNDPVQEKVFKQTNVAKDAASWGSMVESSRVADTPPGENEGAGNSRLTYTFSDWGKGHQVNIQINNNQGTPIVLNPSDTLVHQRLSDHGGQHHGQPEWVFQEEHEQSHHARKQPQPDEEQA